MVKKPLSKGIEKFSELRKRAEELLYSRKTRIPDSMQQDLGKMIHELDTYQVELELQNEDLRTALDIVEHSRSKYSDLYEFAPVAYLSISDKGIIKKANLTAVDMFGVERKYLLGRPLSACIFDDDQDIYFRHRKKLLESENRQHCELRMKREDQSPFPVQLESVIRPEVDGAEGHFRVMITDLSEQKTAELEIYKLESQLRKAHKMEALGVMAGGIAHDFNNILAIILGNSEFIKEDLPPESPLIAHIDHILTACLRAKDMVGHILSFGDMPTLKRDYPPLDLSLVIMEILKFQRSIIPSSIEIIADIDNCGHINADLTQIHQVMMNLCTNATHTVAEQGGVLKVGLEAIELSEDDVAHLPDVYSGDYLRLSVSDNGNGIEPKILEKIFDPYFTTKEFGQGSGMGLAVVHGIVKNHAGFVRVESTQGKGTTFFVYFPKTEEVQGLDADGSSRDLPTGTERILFIDDMEMLTDIGKVMLERLGYTVTTMIDSSKALELFNRQPAEFDLVITDYTMPKLTGAELATQMLEIRPDLPIILLTGYSEYINEVKAKQIGFAAYTLKPVNIHTFSCLIRTVLDNSPRT